MLRQYFFPAIYKRCPEQKRYTDDHATCIEHMDAVSRYVNFSGTEPTGDIDKAVEALATLSSSMLPHLKEGSRPPPHVPPLLQHPR